MAGYKHDWLKSYEEVQEAGRSVRRRAPGLLRGRGRQGQARRRGHRLLHLRHHGQSQGRHDHPRQCHRGGRDLLPGGGREAGGHVARVPAHGLGGRRHLHPLREPGGRILLQLPGEPGDGAARPPGARAHHRARPAPDLGEHAHRRPGAGGRRHAAQAPHLQLLPLRRRARRDPARGRQARAGRAAPRHRARRVLRLRPRARPARAAAGEVGAHRRRAARPGHLPVLPLHRRQPQAGLRVHRDERPRLAPAGHRGQPHERGPPGARASR